MRILLIGSNGQLGNDFRKLFDKKNIEYTATDYQEMDITDDKAMKQFFDKNNSFTHIITVRHIMM